LNKLISILFLLFASITLLSQTPPIIVGDTNSSIVFYQKPDTIFIARPDPVIIGAYEGIDYLDLDRDGIPDLEIRTGSTVNNHSHQYVYLLTLKDSFYSRVTFENYTCTGNASCVGPYTKRFLYMFNTGDTLSDSLIGGWATFGDFLQYNALGYVSPGVNNWVNKGIHFIGFKWIWRGIPVFGWIRAGSGLYAARILDYAIQKTDIPKLSKPVGTHSVFKLENTTSSYFVNSDKLIDKYEFYLEPVYAGSFESKDTLATVRWNTDFSGMASLKVKGLNYCGSGDYSDTISITVKAIPENSPVILYPTPSKDRLSVSSPVIIEKYEIVNLRGSSVASAIVNSDFFSIDLSLLDLAGMYILKLTSIEGITQGKKFIVE
jgi:hypothetical protein